MYRVYCFDGGSRIIKADWIEAFNDAQALQEAKSAMPDCFRTEVWDRDRLVGRIEPRSRPEFQASACYSGNASRPRSLTPAQFDLDSAAAGASQLSLRLMASSASNSSSCAISSNGRRAWSVLQVDARKRHWVATLRSCSGSLGMAEKRPCWGLASSVSDPKRQMTRDGR